MSVISERVLLSYPMTTIDTYRQGRKRTMKFELLADSIKQINEKASSAAKSAVNQLMTLRNWAIGYYIVEYEQDGSDRAEYGSHLLKNLEKKIDYKGLNETLFKVCRQFYKVYPTNWFDSVEQI